LLATHETTGLSRLVFASQIAGLVGALVLIAIAIWYFSRPATSNDLYAQIDKEAEEGRADSLRTVERQIDEFLRRFPDDPRADEIAGYKDEIDLTRREAVIFSKQGRESLAPVERLYLEAIRKAETDPQQAVRDLQSILVLYHRDGEGIAVTVPKLDDQTEEARALNRQTEECIALVERRLEQLSTSIEAEANNLRRHMQSRLDEAHAFRPTDPDRALQWYLAIVNLCEGKQWARDIVAEAREAIEAMNESIPTKAGQELEARAHDVGRGSPEVEGNRAGSDS
jgi:hypothetical protein